MLKKIEIKNFLTIENINFDVGEKITAITGESGAGKSLVLKAVESVFAQKAQTDIIGNFGDKSSIKLFFELNDKQLDFIRQLGIDDDEIVIERVIQPKKSKAYINHEPINTKLLSNIGDKLINTISQTYKTEAFNEENIRYVIDKIADSETYREFRAVYEQYKEIELKEVETIKKIKEIDSKHPEILLESIENINPKKNEYDELLNKSKRIKSIVFVKEKLSDMIDTLYEKDDSFESKLSDFIESLMKISSSGFDIDSVSKGLNDAYNSISEIKYGLYDLFNKDYSNEDIDTIESRLFELEKLQRKFSKTVNEIIQEKEELKIQIKKKEELSYELEKIQKEKKKIESVLHTKADILTKKRIAASKAIVEKIKIFLDKLMLKDSIVRFQFTKKEIDKTGQDVIDILFSANPDIEPNRIEKTASGGERSRFILAMKCAYSSIEKNKETLILDEIETGISKKTLNSMIDVIKELSLSNQIILITHEEKLANMANTTISILKEFDGSKTKSFAQIKQS